MHDLRKINSKFAKKMYTISIIFLRKYIFFKIKQKIALILCKHIYRKIHQKISIFCCIAENYQKIHILSQIGRKTYYLIIRTDIKAYKKEFSA